MKRKLPMVLIVCTILVVGIWIYYYIANGSLIFFAGSGESLSSCLGLAALIGAWIRYFRSSGKK